MSSQPVLIDGQWRAAQATSTFQATNPTTGKVLPELYPVSSWSDCEAALAAAVQAASVLRQLPVETLADFLCAYADQMEQAQDDLVELAHSETGLPRTPRLADVELPRTANQLRQAAAALHSGF